MTNKQLIEICKAFELGQPICSPKSVTGGLLHAVWHITTDKASYAIKQLSKDINLKNKAIRQNYELTEKIAFRFSQQGIPAISAIKQNDQHIVKIDGTGFLAYPWINAQAIDCNALSEPFALRIAKILAHIHFINLKIPEIEKPHFDTHTSDYILEMIRQAEAHDCPFVSNLRENETTICSMNEAYHSSVSLLKKHVVVSHGDLDQKNVLWDGIGNPYLIDWEAARKVNSTYEIINTSLDWSGITTESFNKNLFEKMVHTYVKAGGRINQSLLQAAYYGVCGNWINWMLYNIKRTYTKDETETKNLSVKQVNQTLSILIRLKNFSFNY
jgi:thiamine kinase-like enzyme